MTSLIIFSSKSFNKGRVVLYIFLYDLNIIIIWLNDNKIRCIDQTKSAEIEYSLIIYNILKIFFRRENEEESTIIILYNI